jgi:hypothetical protein
MDFDNGGSVLGGDLDVLSRYDAKIGYRAPFGVPIVSLFARTASG